MPVTERTRLRKKRELSRRWAVQPEIGMQPETRNGNAEAVWADDAKQIRSRLVEDRLLELGTKPCRDDDDRAGTFLAERSHQFWDGVGWGRDDRKLGRLGQRSNVGEAPSPADRLMVRID